MRPRERIATWRSAITLRARFVAVTTMPPRPKTHPCAASTWPLSRRGQFTVRAWQHGMSNERIERPGSCRNLRLLPGRWRRVLPDSPPTSGLDATYRRKMVKARLISAVLRDFGRLAEGGRTSTRRLGVARMARPAICAHRWPMARSCPRDTATNQQLLPQHIW